MVGQLLSRRRFFGLLPALPVAAKAPIAAVPELGAVTAVTVISGGSEYVGPPLMKVTPEMIARIDWGALHRPGYIEWRRD